MSHSRGEVVWEEINIADIGGIKIGNAQNQEAMTGVTVVLFDGPNAGGVDVSGGGPGISGDAAPLADDQSGAVKRPCALRRLRLWLERFSWGDALPGGAGDGTAGTQYGHSAGLPILHF